MWISSTWTTSTSWYITLLSQHISNISSFLWVFFTTPTCVYNYCPPGNVNNVTQDTYHYCYTHGSNVMTTLTQHQHYSWTKSKPQVGKSGRRIFSKTCQYTLTLVYKNESAIIYFLYDDHHFNVPYFTMFATHTNALLLRSLPTYNLYKERTDTIYMY